MKMVFSFNKNIFSFPISQKMYSWSWSFNWNKTLSAQISSEKHLTVRNSNCRIEFECWPIIPEQVWKRKTSAEVNKPEELFCVIQLKKKKAWKTSEHSHRKCRASPHQFIYAENLVRTWKIIEYRNICSNTIEQQKEEPAKPAKNQLLGINIVLQHIREFHALK